MAESEQHRILVKKMEIWLNENFPDSKAVVDAQEKPGDPTPPIIGSHRPDLYAELKKQVIIGEAKTSFDIERPHSISQFKSFLSYLEKGKGNQLILSVPHENGGKARFVLEKLRENMTLKKTHMIVFDECDAWFLKAGGKIKWHLF